MRDVETILYDIERELEHDEEALELVHSIARANNDYDIVMFTEDALARLSVDDVYTKKLIIKLACAKLDEE